MKAPLERTMDEQDEAPLDELELMDEVDEEDRVDTDPYHTPHGHAGDDVAI